MKINVCDNTIAAAVCVTHWAMLLRVISDRQRHLRWYCLHFSHWRGRRLSWGVGRRDLTQQAGENLILCPRWIKTSKYIIHGATRPSGIVFFMRRLLRDVSFPFQNEQVHSADPHFAKATPWPSAPFYVFLNVSFIKFVIGLCVAVLAELLLEACSRCSALWRRTIPLQILIAQKVLFLFCVIVT